MSGKMTMMVFRYLQLICVIVFLNSDVHCEEFLPANSGEYIQLLMTTGCTVKCIDENQTMVSAKYMVGIIVERIFAICLEWVTRGKTNISRWVKPEIAMWLKVILSKYIWTFFLLN